MPVDDPRRQLPHAKAAENGKDLPVQAIAILLERGDRAVLLRQVPEPHFGEDANPGLGCDLGIPFVPRTITNRNL